RLARLAAVPAHGGQRGRRDHRHLDPARRPRPPARLSGRRLRASCRSCQGRRTVDATATDARPGRRRLVYRWDLDKTYLRTEFDTVRDLVKTAFESAAQKRTVPGAAALLRELRATEPRGIYIVSGSPEQLRRVLEAKLKLD